MLYLIIILKIIYVPNYYRVHFSIMVITEKSIHHYNTLSVIFYLLILIALNFVVGSLKQLTPFVYTEKYIIYVYLLDCIVNIQL